MPVIRLTPVVKFLLISCLVAFLIQQTADQFLGGNLTSLFGLVPAHAVFHFYLWQLGTYAFLHGDVLQLFLNLLMLVFIGSDLEALWGKTRFLKYYFFCSVSAGLLYLFLQIFVWRESGLYTPMVGASGAIYGLLLAYGLIFGERVFLFLLLFPMKAKHFIWILAAMELMTTVFSGRGGLASAAHLGGMAAGFAYLLARATWKLRKSRKASGAPQKSQSHLKLIIDNERKQPRRPAWEDPDNDPKTWH